MSYLTRMFDALKSLEGEAASLPCPNCSGTVHEKEGSPVSSGVNTYRCRACGWSKLSCGGNCGSYLEYSAGTYTCQGCGWTGHAPSYSGDSDGRPPAGRSRPEPPKGQCHHCGAAIRGGDLVMKHSSSALMVCERCARAGGFGDGLERYR